MNRCIAALAVLGCWLAIACTSSPGQPGDGVARTSRPEPVRTARTPEPRATALPMRPSMQPRILRPSARDQSTLRVTRPVGIALAPRTRECKGRRQAAPGAFCATTDCPAGSVMCSSNPRAAQGPIWPGAQAGRCVSPTDPAFGCGSPSCQRCSLPHAVPAATERTRVGRLQRQPEGRGEATVDSPSSCGGCSVQCNAPTMPRVAACQPARPH